MNTEKLNDEDKRSLSKTLLDAFRRGVRLNPTIVHLAQENIAVSDLEALNEDINASEVFRWLMQVRYNQDLAIQTLKDIDAFIFERNEDEKIDEGMEYVRYTFGGECTILTIRVDLSPQYKSFEKTFKENIEAFDKTCPQCLYMVTKDEVNIHRDITTTQLREIGKVWMKTVKECFGGSIEEVIKEQFDQYLRLFPSQSALVLMPTPTGFTNFMIPDAQNFRKGGNQFRCVTLLEKPVPETRTFLTQESWSNIRKQDIINALFKFFQGKRIAVPHLKGEYIWMVPHSGVKDETINAMIDKVDELVESKDLFQHFGWVKPFVILTHQDEDLNQQSDECVYKLKGNLLRLNQPIHKELVEEFEEEMRNILFPNVKSSFGRRADLTNTHLARLLTRFELI